MLSGVIAKWGLILAGTVIWSVTMVKSGLVYDYGMGFWGPHGHDGIWHIALINSLSRGSFQMPIFAGEPIKNYHLGFDLFLAALRRLSRIPAVNLYFQILPPILAFFIGYLTYRLTQNLWSVFFVYFGGSLGWLVGRGESAFWSQQAISTLINPPYALSLVLLLLLLLLLKRDRFFLAALVLAVLPHIKIYAGVLAFMALFFTGLKNKKLFLSLVFGFLIYLPSNYQLIANNSQLLAWSPGWFLATMMAYSDRLGWDRFYSAMTNYRLAGSWPKIVLAYTAALGIFILGNFGTRLVALRQFKLASWFDYFVWSVILLGVLVPMLFIQSGTPWNTIQFLYYSLFFSSILAGPAFEDILKIKKLKNYLRIVIWSLVIFFTISTTWDTLSRVYLPSRPPAKISPAELSALKFLARQPPGVVLTYPVTPDASAPPPRPLYLYESTAYVAALSGQLVYLEDEVNLNITGYDWLSRRRKSLEFFQRPDHQFLTQNNIRYIYLTARQFTPPNSILLYDQDQTQIWQVN